MSEKKKQSRKVHMEVFFYVAIYVVLFVSLLIVNRMQIRFFLNVVSVSGIIVALEMTVAIMMTLKHHKVGGGTAKVLLCISLLSLVMAIIRAGNLEPLPGILELVVGIVAVSMIQINKSAAEKIYNKDSLAVNSISSIFLAMYFLDLHNDTYAEYNAAEAIKQKIGKEGKGIQDIFNREVISTIDEDFVEETLAFVDLTDISKRMAGKKIISLDTKSNHYGWCRLSFLPVQYNDHDEIERLLFSMQIVDDDRQKELKYQEELLYLSRHDELTELYNRNYFMERVSSLLKQDTDQSYCILCMDIKNFRLVNEMLGKDNADAILKNIAKLLREKCKNQMLYARLAGDRFAICMKEEMLSEKFMQDICDEVAMMEQDNGLRMHLQIGVYKVDHPEEEPSVMCDRAIEAINVIKSDYQKYISYYDDRMRASLLKENIMLGEIETALQEQQFIMYLQPQVSKDGDLLGAEALARWKHPEKGMVPPGEFIPVLEKYGQVVNLDRVIWELACAQLKTWKEKGLEDLHISVNISPKDFYSVNLYEVLTGLVQKYEISPCNLKLEITETTMMTEASRQTDLLKRLRAFGFEIEIDDFGSGYSSLNTLENMEVDVLKIDMGFLRQSQHNERSRTVLNFVIVLAKSLGLVTITEGVENEEQVETLNEAGCDIFQGYFFSKPLPVDEFEEKYRLL